MLTPETLIRQLDLQPLPGEGGCFRQTWILPSTDGDPPLGTAILYLITPESFSALHRLDADEIFHFYLGDACEQIVIDANGEAHIGILGPDLLAGQQVQTVVPRGSWQGTRLLPGGAWALVGTTMTPGYHQDGFELATRADLGDWPETTRILATSYLADGA